MKIPDCAASGYGVLIKDKKAGKYIFYKFDEKGNEIAKKLLETTKKTDNIKIKVKGTMMKDLIMIESIVEK
jgi:5S rRNA maturation endonuclease (ribonuclease M5)